MASEWVNRGFEVEKEERLWGLQRGLPPLSTFSLQISGGENEKRELLPTAAKGQGQHSEGRVTEAVSTQVWLRERRD